MTTSQQTDASGQHMVGQVLGDRYELVRLLGEGGMGAVYEARHIHIEKRVALKLLRPEILSNAEAVTRFRQEARSASSIGHENIIQIDDFGTLPDGRVYLAMEFLEGAPLASLIKHGALPLAQVLDILVQTCRGLAAAHAKGIVHRDMKPENVYVVPTPDGRSRAKLLDFGIAKVSQGDNNATLTRTGAIFGTPYYMSPEQALGQAVDHRTDIYAMGVIMYEVFCGQVPFQADSFMGILTQHITHEPPDPAAVAQVNNRQIVPEVQDIIRRALAKDPAQRQQSMNQLVEELVGVYRAYVGQGITAPPAAPPMGSAIGSAVHHATAGHAAPTPNPYTRSQPVSRLTTEAPPKKGNGLAIAVALLVLAVGGAAGWYFAAGPGADSGGPAQQAAVLPTPAAPKPEPVPEPEPEPTPPPDKPDPAPAVATPVKVLVDSLPRGAELYEGDELIGATPSMIQITDGKPRTLTLKREGFKSGTIEIDASRDLYFHKLEVDPDAPRGRGRPDRGRDRDRPDRPTGETKPDVEPVKPPPADKPPHVVKPPPDRPKDPDDVELE